MTIKLPITVSAEEQVSEQFDLNKQILERIEAWANFETMKANWFEDEDYNIRCQFTLISQHTFDEKFRALDSTDWSVDTDKCTAVKLGDIAQKQHVFITITDELNAAIEQAGTWIGSNVQANVQQLIRQWLLVLADKYQFDAID
ncbi:hypothetical protein ACFSJY_02595 [Thalassotalea euphylliae]|uniref:hypothetical protein n=1 Tax=Thalassotalea euphylliae TaxID=1655234 RepID=UPI00364087A1